MANGFFFCHACLEDKSVSEQSLDSRYCRGCCEFLLQEAEVLPVNKRPKWIPKAQSKTDSTGKNRGQEVIQVSQDVVLNMSTLKSEKSKVDIIQPPGTNRALGKRGPKQKDLPHEIIEQWASDGMGSKAIASKVNSEHGVKVSYKTIQRLLSGERRVQQCFDRHGERSNAKQKR
ncbi:hypothetical protein ACFLVN_04200 [Chloroflexota bacterium]